MKIKKMRIFFLSIIMSIMMFWTPVMAVNINELELEEPKYTYEYENWLKLSDEEKSKTIQPKKYDINNEDVNVLQKTNNPLQIDRMLKSLNSTQYSLQDIISNNTKVKDQEDTNSCWAFVSLGALETNLAMQDYKLNTSEKLYDFSERHMVYSSSRDAFLNNQINENGFNTNISGGGHYYMAQAYLTNGSGAINEYELPFENNESNIDISNIQNKNVVTTLYDTVEFSKNSSDNTQLIQDMKAHISTYGGIYSSIYGTGIEDSEYYNNSTGAIYVDDASKLVNHSVLIIGWDDNYSKDNFASSHKPQNDGAWIVRNSWGEKKEETLDNIKKLNFEANKETYIQAGYNSYQELPDDPFIELFVQNGYTPNEDNTVFTYNIGNNGYMYVSYEDVNIYSQLWGIKKASNEKDYEKIYQNDVLGFSQAVQIQTNVEKTYIANVLKRTTSETEKIDKISLYTIQKWKNCKVYINPNDTDKSKSSLTEVKLKSGDINTNEIDIDVGYHMIEFAEPIEVTGDSFVVVVEFQTDEWPLISLESKTQGGWDYVTYNENESFFTVDEGIETNVWQDTALISNEDFRGNVLIKAFTQKETYSTNVQLSNIAITKQPDKSYYKEGEDFDVSGMEVTATYSDGTKNIIYDYVIEDGKALPIGKDFVLVSYTENGITVKATLPIVVTSTGNVNSDNKLPKASDFSNANAVFTRIKIQNEDNIFEVSIKVSNIKIGDEDDKYTYSYCILGTPYTTSIKDEYWTSIDSSNIYKENDGTYTINLDIDWTKLKNLDELQNATDLYIHIKEIAEINDQSIETINPIKIGINENTQSTTDVEKATVNNSNSANDNTVSNKILPKTGKISIVIVFIVLIGIGSFSYFRYKNIDR